jgi:hypothetical protein
MGMVTLNPISLKAWQDNDLEHLRYEYDLKPEDIVFDIGSYRQEWADEIRKRYGCYVECFEALDNKAAGTEDGTILMGGAFYYTSMFTDKPHTEYKCVDIARYITKEIALVKINIEGFEYPLLSYIIEKGLIGLIKNIQVQFHLIEGVDTEKLYQDIATELTKTHKLTWQYKNCWENWERL